MMRHANPIRRILRPMFIGLSLVVAAGTVWGAYGGTVMPSESTMSALSGLMCLAFPLWVLADIVVILADAWLSPRWIAAPLIAIIASSPTLGEYFPCSTSARTADSLDSLERTRSFTLLTYNTSSFRDTEGVYPDSGNRTLQQIIDRDADMVCLQEVFAHKIKKRLDSLKITRAQREKIDSIYPHRTMTFDGMVFLSKYPFRGDRYQRKPGDAAEMSRFEVEIEGHRLTIFNLHLQSLGLKRSEKKVFKELTDMSGSRDDIKEMRNTLLSKYKRANITRADQASRIVDYIAEDGGENVIVCGDFNDVPASYTYRLIRASGLHDAYNETAFWPGVTHYADNFYFRIDHILYRGSLKAINVHRGNVRSSDHYWLEATFLWDAPEDKDKTQKDSNN